MLNHLKRNKNIKAVEIENTNDCKTLLKRKGNMEPIVPPKKDPIRAKTKAPQNLPINSSLKTNTDINAAKDALRK